MLNVYLGGTLMVLGLIALIGMPTAGVVMIGAGYWLFQQSTAAQRHGAQSLFFGIALLCMIITSLAALFGFS